MLLAVLQKLEVVLKPALDELFDGDLAVDFVAVKHPLQHLVVVEKLVLGLDVELDLAHRYVSVDGVENLAVNGAFAALLDLGDVGDEQFIDPLDQFLSGHFDVVVVS